MDEATERALRAALEPFDGAPNTPETRAGIVGVLIDFLPPVIVSDHIEVSVEAGAHTHEIIVMFEGKTELGNDLIYGMHESIEPIPPTFHATIPVIPSLAAWPDRRRLKRILNRERKARQRAAKKGSRHA